ncbi:MAG: molybdopterin-binding protein [Pseudomonadota bacterium]
MKQVPVQNAVGMILSHDITRIVPGECKGPAFRKGQVIQVGDIPRLLEIGKEHVFAYDLADGDVHEDDAAQRIARAAAGPGLTLTQPVEGKVNLVAAQTGLLKVRLETLHRLNAIEDVMFATLHNNRPVEPGTPVAGTRVIPLAVGEETVAMAEAVCGSDFPLIEVKPFVSSRVGIITTGSEVFHGRIQDRFGPVLHMKFAELGSQVMRQDFVSDDVAMTVGAIHSLLADGAEFIALTGGMSVDPDDQTPASIRAAGGEVVTYGAPVLPGAMFMLAYIGDVPVVGLPGCVMYYRTSIFDLTVPRILAGERLTRQDIIAMGHGGFCSGCDTCRYPGCAFGKGS